MLRWIDVYRVNQMSYGISNVLITTVVKGALVFGIVHLFVSKSKGLTPAHRHLFWLFAATSCLLAPFLSYVAFPVRVIDPSFLIEKRSAIQAASASFLQWFFPFQFKTVWQMESGSYFCMNKVTRLHRLSWESWAAIVWAAGALYSLVTIGMANLRLAELSRSALPAERPAHSDLLRAATRRAGIGREVRLLFSSRCRVPFAWNPLKPTILMPADAARWRLGRLRTVLTHELAHVKRRDYLTRLLSRIICSFLWFVPYVWIAHSNLHDEQEQACDEITVREGAAPAEYAGYLVALARSLTRRDAVYAGIFLSRAHKSSLETRVAALLKTPFVVRRPALAGFAGPFLLCVLCSLPLLLFKPAMGEPSRNYVGAGAASAQVAGAWVNSEYGFHRFPPLAQKVVITTSGDLGQWGRADDFGPTYRLRYEIVQCWVGKDGSLYCQVHVIHPVIDLDSSTELWRLDRSGRLLETMYRGGIVDEFPERFDSTPDPRSPDNYAVYHRE